MNRFIRVASIIAIAVTSWLLLMLLLTSLSPADARARQRPSTPNGLYAPGEMVVPLGQGQPDSLARRSSYKALWQAMIEQRPLAWAAVTTTVDGSTFAPGAVVGELPDESSYLAVHASAPFSLAQSFALQPPHIAVFDSALRDEYGQTVVWERGDFESLFRVYLWCPPRADGSCSYFDVVSETDILAGRLDNYDLLIVPAIRAGWAVTIANSLDISGLNAIQRFWLAGGSLYAQSDGAYIAQAAGLVSPGTIDPATRVTAPGNDGALVIDQPEHPATFSWLTPTMYVLSEPLFSVTAGVTSVAHYAGGSHPDTPAILANDGSMTPEGAGRILLVSGHPSDRQSDLPQLLSGLLSLMTRRANLYGQARQEYNPALPPDLLPAYSRAAVAVTNTFRNLWDGPMQEVIVTDTIAPRFTVDISDVRPAPAFFITSPITGTTIVWVYTETLPGDTEMGYVAWTMTDTLSAGSAKVSSAQATYRDPFELRLSASGDITAVGELYALARPDLAVSAKMPARLNGDRDIELDGLYPLPAQGFYFDIAGTLENKEETDANHVVVTDIVALISPIVDVNDQTQLARVITDVAGGGAAVSETLWASNQIFFYNTPTPLYPLPSLGSIMATTGISYGLANANTVYTFTGQFTSTQGYTNSITIPDAYSDVIRLTPDGVVMPALKLVYDLGTQPGYDYQDPAWRYGLHSRELFGRQVSHISDPMFDQGVIASGSGSTIFTNIGGHPIPYHEYLSSGIIAIPIGDEIARIAYEDLWSRPFTMELRTASYDVVPFPPPEYHAVVNTTFALYADLDRDGVRDDFVLDYPANKDIPADLRLMVKSYSNFDPTMPLLRKDETLIAQGMFKGLGYALEPRNGTWQESWSFRNLQGKYPTATELITVVNTPAYDYLYFQQELNSRSYEAIDITATLRSLPQTHKEGIFKTNDGARFVYHQKAVGPSRYEVFDSHVQAVFGLSTDPVVTKKVAPARVATYDDTIYHVIELKDPWDPRTLGYEPHLQSYGYGDMAATVYVGGRHGETLLYPRVAPGGKTQIRVEIDNNTGVTLTHFAITPVAASGISVTARPTVETQAIEPLFFDFPFLHRTTVPDAWKTVWYFDVQVEQWFTGELGSVYPVNFTVSADGLKPDFSVPAARIGIEDQAGIVRDIYGTALNLELSDPLPPWITLLDARIANAAETEALMAELAIGHDVTATDVYSNLRGSVTTTLEVITTGTNVSFQLPPEANQLPWNDRGARNGTLYVILRSHAEIEGSGTTLANEGPVMRSTDPFMQVYTVTGNQQTVEAHGAHLIVDYILNGVQVGGVLTNGLTPSTTNVVSAVVRASNLGDYIARGVRITVTLGTGVTLSQASPSPVYSDSQIAVFDLGDLAPAQIAQAELVLTMTPLMGTSSRQRASLLPPFPPLPRRQWVVLDSIDGQFINEFMTVANTTRQVLVNRRLKDEFRVGQSYHIYRVYLWAVVSKNHPMSDR